MLGASMASQGCAAPGPAPNDPSRAAATPGPLRPGALANIELDVSTLGRRGFVSEEQWFAELDRVSLVCLGEQHDNLVHHALQRRVLSRVLDRAKASERAVALGLEMFQRPAQAALDAFRRGEIDESALLERSEYEARWGYDFEYYRDSINLTRAHGGGLLALNAPKEWTKSVAKRGLAGLGAVGASLNASDLVLDDADHQRFFSRAMGAFHGAAHRHGVGHSQASVDWSAEPFYAAQVVWDETMADTAARWLAETPGGLVIVLAGAGHCHRSAIPRRFERRQPGLSSWGVQLQERSGLGEPSIPSRSEFDWILIAENG